MKTHVEHSISYEQNHDLEKFEICVCCKKRTNVLCREDIRTRKYYVIGGGQLCEACFYDLQYQESLGDIQQNEREMKQLLRLCKDDKKGRCRNMTDVIVLKSYKK